MVGHGRLILSFNRNEYSFSGHVYLFVNVSNSRSKRDQSVSAFDTRVSPRNLSFTVRETAPSKNKISDRFRWNSPAQDLFIR